MTRELVHYEVLGAVARFTLDDAPANGYSHEMMLQLDACVLRARFDDAVQVIVITGAGEKFFCAGANIDGLAAMTQSFKYNFCLHANETLLRLEQTPKLVIAALNGHCVGGGLEIALACDFRVMRTGGGKLGLPEVALGVLPGTGGTQRLARLVGKARALELMVQGRTMAPNEGLLLGLLTAIFEASDFQTAVLEYARSFCTPGKAAMAVGLIKRAVQSGAEVPLESGLALERELQARLFASGDARRGLDAFLNKTKPEFEGC
ncbi:MAG: enoyl-CoA hydratase/isomerase family protein [Planctomycetes bacterium]|nr:enoyl-CoA hydratase/isomerase family protein [Planctomycetota bacterium]